MSKLVRIIGAEHKVIREVERSEAREMVKRGDGYWWDSGRAVKIHVTDTDREYTGSTHSRAALGKADAEALAGLYGDPKKLPRTQRERLLGWGIEPTS